MKLYERIENNNFDEIDKNRAIELIEGGNGHLVYNENHFKLQKENEKLKNFTSSIFNESIERDFISVQTIKDFIKKYKKLSDEFYEKFLETNRTDKDLHDTGLACDAKVNVLKKVLKEGKESYEKTLFI